MVLLALLQWSERKHISAWFGLITSLAIAIGLHEGIATALGQSGEMFSLATIAGFMGLSVWVIATGIGLFRRA